MNQKEKIVKKAFLTGSMLAALAFTPAQAQQNVTIQMDGAAVPYYLPMFVAEHYGYFEDAGLSVDFLYAGASEILSNLAVGNVEFGFPNGDAVVAARANGLPVQVVHTTYQRGIGAVMFKSESGIETPADLVGRRVAVTSFGSPNYIQLQVMMEEAGHSIDDVDVQIVGTGAILDALTTDQVDAIVFSMLRYYALQAQGVDVGMIQSDDYLPSFGNVLVVSDAYLEQNPETVAGFIEALDRALEHIVEGDAEEEVQLVISEYTQSFIGQEEVVTEIIEQVFIPQLWQSADTEEHGFGYGNLENWQQTIDTAASYGVIPSGFDADEMVTQPSEIGG